MNECVLEREREIVVRGLHWSGPGHFCCLHDLRNAQEHELAKGTCLACTRDDQSVELETAVELYRTSFSSGLVEPMNFQSWRYKKMNGLMHFKHLGAH